MKFNCSQQKLSKALNPVSKAVSTRSALPILKGILLKAEGNELIMSASDMDISIVKKTEILCEEEYKCLSDRIDLWCDNFAFSCCIPNQNRLVCII